MLVGVYTIPVLITYLGLLSSMSAAMLAINGNYKIAIILFMLSGLFDMFDGKIARKLNKTEKEKLFGIQIDSIIDVCSFGIVPTIIGYSMGLNTVLDYGIFLLYIVGATMRLAYFNYLVLSTETKEEEKNVRKYYLGLPVTFCSVILPIVYVLSYLITQGFNATVLRITYALIAILFVVKVKLPKLTGIWYVILPAIAVLWTILTFIVL